MTKRPRHDPRSELLHLLHRSLQEVNGEIAVRRRLRRAPSRGEWSVLALGKAAQAMVLGAAKALGNRLRDGLIISKPGHLDQAQLGQKGWSALEGDHPLPGTLSLEAGAALAVWLEQTRNRSRMLLLSGGASSLVEIPAPGVSLADLQRANHWLLASGYPIADVNGVRKALSSIKGGGLLRWPGVWRVLAISDVQGDDPAVIGSGLLVPESDLPGAVELLELPDWLSVLVHRGLASRRSLPGAGPEIEIVANLELALTAARDTAGEMGYPVVLHERREWGDAADTGRKLALCLKEGPPGVHLWGGETTVKLPPRPGCGGRNQHLALAAASVLAGCNNCYLLAAGTDGTDGPTEDAGALVDGGTIDRARVEGFVAEDALRRADAGTLLAASGDLVQTGPTGTNVMDLIIGLKLKQGVL